MQLILNLEHSLPRYSLTVSTPASWWVRVVEVWISSLCGLHLIHLYMYLYFIGTKIKACCHKICGLSIIPAPYFIIYWCALCVLGCVVKTKRRRGPTLNGAIKHIKPFNYIKIVLMMIIVSSSSCIEAVNIIVFILRGRDHKMWPETNTTPPLLRSCAPYMCEERGAARH